MNMEVNQKLNTLAFSYVFLGIMEGIIFLCLRILIMEDIWRWNNVMNGMV